MDVAMKSLFRVIILLFIAASAASEEIAIGQEHIKPNRFPKISFAGEYNVFRHGKFLGESDIATDIDPAFGAAVFFDVNLLKYLNAGAGFSSTIGNLRKDREPVHLRFSLFAKPIFAINDRITIFSRIGGGLSIMGSSPLYHFKRIGSGALKRQLGEIYGSQGYALASPGINGMATIGVEYFPFSRFGFAFEWGIRTDLYYSGRSNLIGDIIEQDLSDAKAPSSIKYFGFEMPLALTVHVIL